MKQKKLETESVIDKPKQAIPRPPPPPPPLPLPRFWARKTSADSVTNREIAKFWRQKHADEEDHLLAAIKAAARKRGCNLSEKDYKSFEESLSDEEYYSKQNIAAPTNNNKDNGKNNEVLYNILATLITMRINIHGKSYYIRYQHEISMSYSFLK